MTTNHGARFQKIEQNQGSTLRQLKFTNMTSGQNMFIDDLSAARCYKTAFKLCDLHFYVGHFVIHWKVLWL